MFQFTQRANGKKAFSAGLSMIACVTAAALSGANAAEPTYTVGARTTVLGNNVGGLTQFPEAPISILQTTPEYHVLISTGLKTAFCKGASMSTLSATSYALQPSNAKGYDEVSAHITSTWKDPETGDIYGVFNANDSDGVPRIPGPGIGFRGRYFTTSLAKSTNGGANFSKIGPILSIPKNATADPLQGDAFGSVVMSPDKQYLYLYYGDMYRAQFRHGVQTCVARATVASKGLPGSWKKWYSMDWVTPGISLIDTATYEGAETDPVVTFPGLDSGYNGDAMYPHVVYSAKAGCYIMVYAVNSFDDIPEADSLGHFPAVQKSGIYITYSKDGLNWVGSHMLVKSVVIDYPGREVALHPAIVVDEAAAGAGIKATVYYGYSANMWLGTPATQYLVSQTVDISALPSDFFTAGIVTKSKSSRGAPGYSLLQGGAGEFMLSFKNDVNALKVITADGSSAGKAVRVGQGRYQLQVSRSVAGPYFLQGKQNGRTFSSFLRLP